MLGCPVVEPLIVGEVIGFVLEWQGQRNGAVGISGDTVWVLGITRRLLSASTSAPAIVDLGCVRFLVICLVCYTMNAVEAHLASPGDFELRTPRSDRLRKR